MHLFRFPGFYGNRMNPGEYAESGAVVAKYGIGMGAALVIVASRGDGCGEGRTIQGVLIREKHLLGPATFPAFRKQAPFPNHGHIHQEDAGIDVFAVPGGLARIYPLPVIVRDGHVFHSVQFLVVEFRTV